MITGPTSNDWIQQFDNEDLELAEKLRQAILFVPHNELYDKLRDACLSRFSKRNRLALYAERELKSSSLALFSQPTNRPRRAYGEGPPAIAPGTEVGSEGIIANLITNISREYKGRIFSHPGPDKIRKEAVRKLILVTDFIGSGYQASAYLDAMWQVWSVRSWSSLGLVSIEVIAYSGTSLGVQHIRRHKSKPRVTIVKQCPTIRESFGKTTANRIVDLCYRYTSDKNQRQALGYCQAGALIAFAHGAPNNCPAILISKARKGWKPLFSKRRTTNARKALDEIAEHDLRRWMFERLGEIQLAGSQIVLSSRPDVVKRLLVLAHLSRGPRYPDAISARTSLSLSDIDVALESARQLGWVDDRNRLTNAGHKELREARKSGRAPKVMKNPLPKPTVTWYFPAQLRAPDDL